MLLRTACTGVLCLTLQIMKLSCKCATGLCSCKCASSVCSRPCQVARDKSAWRTQTRSPAIQFSLACFLIVIVIIGKCGVACCTHAARWMHDQCCTATLCGGTRCGSFLCNFNNFTQYSTVQISSGFHLKCVLNSNLHTCFDAANCEATDAAVSCCWLWIKLAVCIPLDKPFACRGILASNIHSSCTQS